MDTYTKALIERRALQLAKLCEYTLLNKDETDELAGVGFRWGYLILRKPKRYLENFRHGTLMIDPALLQDAFWFYQDQIEGCSGLLPVEREILQDHNGECSMWMKQNSVGIGLVSAGGVYDYCRNK
jgi:hypothetical protein